MTQNRKPVKELKPLIMNSNVGLIDRFIRIILVGVIFYAYYIGWTVGWVAIVSAFVAALLLVTAFSGECYLYSWLGISTKSKVKTL